MVFVARSLSIFEGLQAIPWHDLTHAYGSADQVPLWLLQLASADEQMRQEAITHLAAALCHQGWICPATGYAVPSLIELLQEPSVQGKDAILRLLADIADAPPLDEETWRKNPEVPSWEVPAHIRFKDAQDALHPQSLAELLLFIVFGDKPETSRKPRPATTLTEQQRSVLLLVLDRENVWGSSHLHDLLVGHRLPDTREKMAVYLGRDLPPPR